MKLSRAAQGSILLALAGTCFEAKAQSRNRITVQSYNTKYMFDVWDDGRDEPYRVTYWKFGIKSVYTFDVSGHVTTLSAGDTLYKFRLGVPSRMLRTSSDDSIEDARHLESRSLFTCFDCEVAWKTLCDVGLVEVCFWDDNNPAEFDKDAENSVRRFCSAVGNACKRSAGDICDGGCLPGEIIAAVHVIAPLKRSKGFV